MELDPSLLNSLILAIIIGLAGFVWKININTIETNQKIVALESRFSDHARFLELILDKVLPDKSKC